MAEEDVLAQAVAEAANLTAAGVTVPQEAPATASLIEDLQQFVSSPQGQALAQVQEKPMDGGPGAQSLDTQALMADLKQYASAAPEQGQTQEPTIEQQPKR